ARGGVEGDTGTRDPAADDDDVEALAIQGGQCVGAGDHPAAESARARPCTDLVTQVWAKAADTGSMRASSVSLIAAAAASLATPVVASAQLGLPLPPLTDPTQTITDTTGQVTGALPDPVGGVVDTVTGDAGGVV